MARKQEIKLVHPRVALAALNGFADDINYLVQAVRNSHRFLTDKTLDAERVRTVLAEQLQEALDRVDKWYSAE